MSRLRAQRMTRGNKTWLGICPSWLGPWTLDILALIWDLWVFTWDIWLIVMTLAGVYVGLVGVDLRLDPTLYLRADLSYRLREQLETLLLTRQTISVWLRLTFFQKDPRHQWYVQGLQIVPGNTTVSLARSLDHGDLYYDGWKISAGSDWRYQHHHGPSPGETLMAPCSIQKLKEDWQLSVGVKIGAYCTYIEGKTGGREKMKDDERYRKSWRINRTSDFSKSRQRPTSFQMQEMVCKTKPRHSKKPTQMWVKLINLTKTRTQISLPS